MEDWRRQLEQLKIPYPQKHNLICEIAEHVSHFPDENSDVFGPENLLDFYEVHNTKLLKVLESASPRLRSAVELILAGAPLMVLTIYLTREEFMLNFIREGGAGMWVILIIGMLLLLKEMLLLFRVIVIKDHSREHVSPDTMAIVVGTIALVLIGIGSTALGAYYSASAFVRSEGLPINILVAGLSESITCLVVSTSLAATILLLHFFIRQTLVSWKVPQRLVTDR